MKLELHNTGCAILTVTAAVLLNGCADSPQDSARGGALITIESAAHFDEAVLNAEKPVLVDFWAAWCPPCRKMNRIVAKAAGKYVTMMDVAKVEVDQNAVLAARFKIREIPTFIIFYQGKTVSAREGAMPASVFNEWIYEHLKQLDAAVSQSAT